MDKPVYKSDVLEAYLAVVRGNQLDGFAKFQQKFGAKKCDELKAALTKAIRDVQKGKNFNTPKLYKSFMIEEKQKEAFLGFMKKAGFTYVEKGKTPAVPKTTSAKVVPSRVSKPVAPVQAPAPVPTATPVITGPYPNFDAALNFIKGELGGGVMGLREDKSGNYFFNLVGLESQGLQQSNANFRRASERAKKSFRVVIEDQQLKYKELKYNKTDDWEIQEGIYGLTGLDYVIHFQHRRPRGPGDNRAKYTLRRV